MQQYISVPHSSPLFRIFLTDVNSPSLAWLSLGFPAEPCGEHKNKFTANFGLWKTFRKCRWKTIEPRERGLNFSESISDRFSDPFSRSSSHFSYRFQNVPGAISFCRRATLTLPPSSPKSFGKSQAIWAKSGKFGKIQLFFGMQLFCLQLEASCLQWCFLPTVDNFSFFAYSWSFFAYSCSLFTCNWCFFCL